MLPASTPLHNAIQLKAAVESAARARPVADSTVSSQARALLPVTCNAWLAPSARIVSEARSPRAPIAPLDRLRMEQVSYTPVHAHRNIDPKP